MLPPRDEQKVLLEGVSRRSLGGFTWGSEYVERFQVLLNVTGFGLGHCHALKLRLVSNPLPLLTKGQIEVCITTTKLWQCGVTDSV